MLLLVERIELGYPVVRIKEADERIARLTVDIRWGVGGMRRLRPRFEIEENIGQTPPKPPRARKQQIAQGASHAPRQELHASNQGHQTRRI